MYDDRPVTHPGARRFHPDSLPRYQGPEPEKAQTLELDCCPDPVCPQREFNRAAALMLEKLSQAYAAMWLLELSVPKVWPCKADGHTEGCADPSCTYGRDMAKAQATCREWFESAVVSWFRTLSRASCELSGEWTAFTVSEVAGHALTDDVAAPVWVKRDSLEHLREEAVGSDPREIRRWFKPPMRKGGDAS